MKSKIFLVLLTLSLAACAPLFNSLDSATVLETSLLSQAREAETAETPGSALILSSPSLTGSLVNASGQRLVMDFNQPIDSASVAGAVTFYNLNAGAADALRVRGTVLSYTHTVANNLVIFTIDMSNANALIEFEIQADKLSAGNGRYKMDPNGNSRPGESGELYIDYRSVGRAEGASDPVSVNGIARTPNAKVAVSAAGWLSDNRRNIADYSQTLDPTYTNRFALQIRDTRGDNQVTWDAQAFTIYKNVNGVWTEVAMSTPTYSTTNFHLIMEPSASVKKGETYKVVVRPYYIYENAAVLGYVHRGSYNPADFSEYIINFTNHASTPQASLNDWWIDKDAGGQFFFEIETNGSQAIDLSTVTASSLRVQLDNASFHGMTALEPNAFVSYTLQVMETATVNAQNGQVQRFRLYLPAYISNLDGATVRFAPSVLTVAYTDAAYAAADSLSYGDVTTSDGWESYYSSY